MEHRPGDTSVLTTLFRHNAWATRKLLDFCAGLSDEQLKSTTVGAYGSIYATFGHLVYAEVDYVGRATGKALPAPLPTDRFAGFEALKDAAHWAGEELLQLALAARADAMVREAPPEEPVEVEYPLSGLLLQAINHSTEHRAQISAIITQLGIEPPEMDGWAYMWEMGEFREQKSGW